MFDLLYERLEGQIYYFSEDAPHAAKQTSVEFQFRRALGGILRRARYERCEVFLWVHPSSQSRLLWILE
jgi:hypothetical protein